MPKYARKTCLVCGADQLRLFLRIAEAGIPHHNRGHDTVYSYSSVTVCQECQHGQLEKFSHDCWGYHGDEDWDMYWWYVFDPDDVVRLSDLLNACPNPHHPHCSCSIHTALQAACERLYSDVRHVVFPWGKRSFVRLSLEIEAGLPRLTVNKDRGIEPGAQRRNISNKTSNP